MCKADCKATHKEQIQRDYPSHESARIRLNTSISCVESSVQLRKMLIFNAIM